MELNICFCHSVSFFLICTVKRLLFLDPITYSLLKIENCEFVIVMQLVAMQLNLLFIVTNDTEFQKTCVTYLKVLHHKM